MSVHQEQKSLTKSNAGFPNERSPSISDSSEEEDDGLDDESADNSAVCTVILNFTISLFFPLKEIKGNSPYLAFKIR